jgi:hypothetical protein
VLLPEAEIGRALFVQAAIWGFTLTHLCGVVTTTMFQARKNRSNVGTDRMKTILGRKMIAPEIG